MQQLHGRRIKKQEKIEEKQRVEEDEEEEGE